MFNDCFSSLAWAAAAFEADVSKAQELNEKRKTKKLQGILYQFSEEFSR